MSKAKRQARQAKRAARKETRIAKRAERKEKRFNARPMQVLAANQARRQDRKDKETDAQIDQQNKTVEAENANSTMKAEAEAEASRVAAMEQAEEQGGPITPEAQIKAKRYLQRQGVSGIYRDPELLASQVYDTRVSEIQNRLGEERDEIMNDDSIGEDTREEELAALEGEDIEDDIHEDLFDEAAEQFGFDGEEADYMDEQTLGVLFNTGKAAIDKYRAKQYAKNPKNKVLGKTKADYEKEQAEKEAGDTVLQAAQLAAEKTIKKQKVQEYTPQIIAGVVILIIIVAVAYKAGK